VNPASSRDTPIVTVAGGAIVSTPGGAGSFRRGHPAAALPLARLFALT